jgi:hypothetical protein
MVYCAAWYVEFVIQALAARFVILRVTHGKWPPLMMQLHPVLGVDNNPRLCANVLDCYPARAFKMSLAVVQGT